MLSTALGFPGDMSQCSVLALEDPEFSQGLLPPWSQSVLWNWVYQCTFEYYRKYEVRMTRILFNYLPILWKDLEEQKGEIKSSQAIVFELPFWSGKLSYTRLYQVKFKQSHIGPGFLKTWDCNLITILYFVWWVLFVAWHK